MILEAVGNSAGMRAVIDLEPVRDAIAVQHIVQLGSVEAQAVLVANIDRDGAVLPKIADVLVDKGQRSVGRPFCHDLRLRNAVFGRQVEIQRRILRIGSPRRGRRILAAAAQRAARSAGDLAAATFFSLAIARSFI